MDMIALTPSLDKTLTYPGEAGGSADGSALRSMNAATTKRRLLLVDDHPVFRTALRRLLDRQPDLEVCGEAADLQGAAGLAVQLKPDLILLDVSLGDADGLDLFPHLHASGLGTTPVVVLSMHEETAHIDRAHAAGASAYVTKSRDTAHLLAVLREALVSR